MPYILRQTNSSLSSPSTLLGVLAFADLGLTATLNREMARLSARKDSAGQMGNLLRTYESVYLWISLALASAVWFLAPVIAKRWLRASTLQPREIATAVRLMGISIALYLPSQLYVGGLVGLQRQVLINSLQIGWGAFRGIGALLVLWLLSPTIFAFAFWQLVSNLAYCLAVRWSLWGALPSSEFKPHFDRVVFRDTWRYAAGMAGMTLLSAALAQTDKVVVSKMLPLDALGYYTLASSLAQAPMILAASVSTAILPRLTGLVSTGDSDGLARVYHRACGFVAVVALSGGLTLALLAHGFMLAWTGNTTVASNVGLVASLLICAQSVQSTLVVPYNLCLAHGYTKLNLLLGIIVLATLAPLQILLIAKYGIVGGGISWLVVMSCTLPPYVYFVHRRFLPGGLTTWYLRDVGRPLLGILVCLFLCFWCLPASSSRLLALGLIGVVWGISATASAFTIPGFRMEIIEKIGLLPNIVGRMQKRTLRSARMAISRSKKDSSDI